MRVLLVNLERGWRGGERQTLLTALGLKEQGLQPTVLAYKGGPLAQRLKDQHIAVVEKRSVVGAVLHLLSCCRSYSIYHAQTSAALTWLASLKPLLKGKIVFSRRTAFPLVEKGESLTVNYSKRIKRLHWKWTQTDCFVAVSQAAAADPIALGLAPRIIPDAVEYVPADVDHIIAVTDQYQLGGRYVLGTSAALSHEKDPLTTIRAIHALWQKRQDFVFLHFGADGNAKTEAINLVNELGLQDVYLFMGFEPHIEDMYRLMHVFVLSSKYEALGSSVLDAFIYAAPVVATNAGGLTELLADERGVICEVGDFEAIAAACDRILDDEPFRNAMILRALNWVQAEHSVEKMVQNYIQLYDETVLGKAPEPMVDTEPVFTMAADATEPTDQKTD